MNQPTASDVRAFVEGKIRLIDSLPQLTTVDDSMRIAYQNVLSFIGNGK